MPIRSACSTKHFDLFIELGASEEQAYFPVIYANAVTAQAGQTPDLGPDLQPLFDAILTQIPCPQVDLEAPLKMLVTNLGYDQYRGVTAIGRNPCRSDAYRHAVGPYPC